MRRFALRNPDFDVSRKDALLVRWVGLANHDTAVQLAYQEQYLEFQRHLLENLQSAPAENPDWRPRPLALSLRAGAIKAYVLSAVAILDAALAAFGTARGVQRREGEDLYDLTFGQLLGRWGPDGAPREEIAPIWDKLRLLHGYRNHVHLARAADDDAYWQDVLEREADLLRACDECIDFLAEHCNLFGRDA